MINLRGRMVLINEPVPPLGDTPYKEGEYYYRVVDLERTREVIELDQIRYKEWINRIAGWGCHLLMLGYEWHCTDVRHPVGGSCGHRGCPRLNAKGENYG